MHRFDALIIAPCEIIRQEDVLGVIVRNGKQAVIFSMLGLLGFDLLGNLDIKLFALACCDKVDLTVCGLADVNGITTAAKLQINYVFKACSNGVGVVAEHAVTQGGIGKIEFLLRFENFLTLHIVA